MNELRFFSIVNVITADKNITPPGVYTSIKAAAEKARLEVVMIEGESIIAHRYLPGTVKLEKTGKEFTVGLLGKTKGENNIVKFYTTDKEKENVYKAYVPPEPKQDLRAVGWMEDIAIRVKWIKGKWQVVYAGDRVAAGKTYRDGHISATDTRDVEEIIQGPLKVGISVQEQKNKVIVFTAGGLGAVGKKWFTKAKESVKSYKTDKVKFVFIGEENKIIEEGLTTKDFDLVVTNAEEMSRRSGELGWKNFSIHQSTVVITGQGEEIDKLKEYVCVRPGNEGISDYHGARLLIFALNLIINKDRGITEEMQNWAKALRLELVWPGNKKLRELIKEDLEETVRSFIQT